MTVFALAHVVISLVGILSGFVVLFGLIAARRLERWTVLFLFTTVVTSLSGFLFPFHKLLPSHIIGALSLVALALAIVALYARHLNGAWRSIYVVTVVLGLYFNVFVLVAQLFLKVPVLKAIAPTQASAPFIIAQTVVMVVFILLGTLAVKRFHSEPIRATVSFA